MGGHDAALFLFDVDGGFLDVGGLEGAEVVGGLEAFVPGAAIHVREGLHLGGGEEEVDALALVDPLLAAGGGVDDVFEVDAEDGLVLVLEGFRDVVDGVEFTVEILELVEHFLVPEVGLFEVFDELAVEHDEVAGEVGFDVEVFVVRLDARGGAHDVRDGGGGGDGEHVGVAHAVFGDFLADDGPIHFAAAWDVDFAAALGFEEVDGVLREEASIPFAAFVGRVGADFGGEVGGGTIRIVGDGFHELVVELDGGIGGEGEVAFVEGVLDAHDAEADRAVAGVGGQRGFGGVEVDVDDVVEGADGDGDGFLEHLVIERAVTGDVGIEDDGAEVADGGFVGGGVERDLGAEVAGVDDAAVVLRGADVAGVFEGDPWVASFEDHLEHGFPELEGGERARPDFAIGGHLLVFAIALLESGAVEVVEIGDFVGAEERPGAAFFHAFHEEVGNPVGGVHVVAAAAFVTGVFPEIEEVLDVVVPGFEVGATGAAAFSALVDGDELVVVEFEEGDDALRLAIGALDVAAGAADGGP